MRSLDILHATLGCAFLVVVSVQSVESWRRFEFLQLQRSRVTPEPPVGHSAMDLAIGGGAPYHTVLTQLTPPHAKIVFSASVTNRAIQTYFLLGHAIFPRQLMALPGTPSHAGPVLDSMTLDGEANFLLDVGNEIRNTGRRPVTIVTQNTELTLYRIESGGSSK